MKRKKSNGTLEELKLKLSKLKDKELKLEVDLAIREFPELEEILVKLGLFTADIKKLNKDIKLMGPSSGGNDSAITRNNLQIKALEHKISLLKEQNERLAGGIGGKQADLISKRGVITAKLRVYLKEQQDLFTDLEFDPFDVVPSLEDCLGEV